MVNKQLQEKLRFFKLDLLTFLSALATTDAIALELKEISQSTNTAEANLSRIISTLRRVKVGNEILIIPAGRDAAGRLRWKINEQAVNKRELAMFLEKEILGKEAIKISKRSVRG